MGRRIPDDEIAAIVAELKGPAVARRLASERNRIAPAMRQMMVKGCYLVMMSDLDENQKELGKVHEIGKALGFSAREIDDQIAMAGV
jgi:DnaJ-domain-containing protein 1